MKNNKKGFTLIELLAVIAILAILVVLAVPAILDLFTQSKEKAFITQAQSLYKAAEEQLVSAQLSGKTVPDRFSNTGSYSTLQLGSIPSNLNYCIKFAGGKISSFAVSDLNYSITKTSNPTISDLNALDQTRAAVTSCAN